MLLDWFTVFAQILNFFVLMVLLKLFLYGPVVQAMNERKQRVAEEMSGVRAAKAEADSMNADLRAKQDELENRASEVMAQIHRDAEEWRKQAMHSARVEIDALRAEWLSALNREKESVGLNLKKKLTHEVAATASRIISDLSDSDLEQQIVLGFMHKIKNEVHGIDCGNREVIVRTGFNCTESYQQRISSFLNDFFPACNERVFSTDQKLGLGIELIAGDRKWEWNLKSYVSELEKNILTEIKG